MSTSGISYKENAEPAAPGLVFRRNTRSAVHQCLKAFSKETALDDPNQNPVEGGRLQVSPQTGSSRSPWAWLVGTFFGIGRLHPGPGTWAAGATVLLWWLGAQRATHTTLIALLAAVAVTLIGIPASTRVERESGIKDPGFVVIDEVAGQMFALVIAPLRWKYLVLSFILFRCFDIFKPPPLRALERLPDGIGIMIDDVGAGLYSLLVLAIVLKFWPSI